MLGRTRWTCVLVATSFLAADADGRETKASSKSRARGRVTNSAARPGPGTFVVQRIMAIADTNRDGKLTPDEAAAAATKFIRGIDGGAEGSIGPVELAKAMGMPSHPTRNNANVRAIRPPAGDDPGVLPPGGPPGGGPAGRIMSLADLDNDGRLIPQEAGAAAAKLAREAGPKDGGVDLEGLRDGLNRLAGPPPGGPGRPRGDGPDGEPR